MFDYAYQHEKVESAETSWWRMGVMPKPDDKTGGQTDDKPGGNTGGNTGGQTDGKTDGQRRSALGRGVERVYKKYHQVLIGYLRNRLVNKEEAEDVAQEVYYRLSRRGDIPELEFPKAFVLQTAANLLVDLNRKAMDASGGLLGGGVPIDAEAGESGSIFKAGIDYHPTDDALLYASWSQGFRLGSYVAEDTLASLNCDVDSDGHHDEFGLPFFSGARKSDETRRISMTPGLCKQTLQEPRW